MVSRRHHCNNMASPSVDHFGNSVSISNNMSSDIAFSIADSVDNPSISNEPHNKKPRLLALDNTEKAVAKAFGSNDEQWSCITLRVYFKS